MSFAPYLLATHKGEVVDFHDPQVMKHVRARAVLQNIDWEKDPGDIIIKEEDAGLVICKAEDYPDDKPIAIDFEILSSIGQKPFCVDINNSAVVLQNTTYEWQSKQLAFQVEVCNP